MEGWHESCSFLYIFCFYISPLQRTRHPPKEMIPMEPAQFAAQLIARLENLKRQQETMNTLEERLQQIQEVCVTLVLTEEMKDEDVLFWP